MEKPMEKSTYLRFTKQKEWINNRTEDLAGSYEEIFINTSHITDVKFQSEIVGYNRTVVRSAKIVYRPGKTGFSRSYTTHKKSEIMMLKQFLGHRSDVAN